VAYRAVDGDVGHRHGGPGLVGALALQHQHDRAGKHRHQLGERSDRRTERPGVDPWRGTPRLIVGDGLESVFTMLQQLVHSDVRLVGLVVELQLIG